MQPASLASESGPQIWLSGEGARCRRGDIGSAVHGRYVYLVLVTVIGLSGT